MFPTGRESPPRFFQAINMLRTLTKIRDSFRFGRRVTVAATRPFADANAPTAELVCSPVPQERAPELPAISARMLRCNGQRKYALRYEQEFYAALRR